MKPGLSMITKAQRRTIKQIKNNQTTNLNARLVTSLLELGLIERITENDNPWGKYQVTEKGNSHLENS
jgi:hypothetical protein